MRERITVATQPHEILPRYTKMPVELITEGLVLRRCGQRGRPAAHGLN